MHPVIPGNRAPQFLTPESGQVSLVPIRKPRAQVGTVLRLRILVANVNVEDFRGDRFNPSTQSLLCGLIQRRRRSGGNFSCCTVPGRNSLAVQQIQGFRVQIRRHRIQHRSQSGVVYWLVVRSCQPFAPNNHMCVVGLVTRFADPMPNIVRLGTLQDAHL